MRQKLGQYKRLLAVTLLLIITAVVVTGCKSKKEEKLDRNRQITIVDFDTSMGKGTSEFSHIFTNPEDAKRYTVLKEQFTTLNPYTIEKGETYRIPKILHQIWVGPKNPPPYFHTFQEKWRKLHPDWEYHLWTDSEIETLGLELKDIIDQSTNYAEKSDIIRSELLDRFGGVYLDVDMDPFMALDELNNKYDFYVGVENPHKIATTSSRVWLGISIMAAKPHHPVIARWKELIRSRWDEVNKTYNSQIERVINHTYFPFTMAFMEKYQEADESGPLRNMTFPATYFYPLDERNASKRKSSVRAFREKFYDFLEDIHLKKARPFSRIAPETIAVHYWGGSWQPSGVDQVKELQHQLDLLRKDFYRLQTKVSQMEQLQLDQVQKEG